MSKVEPLAAEGWVRVKKGEHVAGRIMIGPAGFSFEPHDGADGERFRCGVASSGGITA